jgi:hypothetical protein
MPNAVMPNPKHIPTHALGDLLAAVKPNVQMPVVAINRAGNIAASINVSLGCNEHLRVQAYQEDGSQAPPGHERLFSPTEQSSGRPMHT